MRNPLLVRVVERGANLHRIFQGLIERQRAFKRRALDVLHRQIIRPDIMERADIGMIQRADGFGFSLKALAEFLLGEFHRDDAVEAGVAGLPDLAHTSAAYGLNEQVWSELVAWLKRHLKD